MKEKYIEPEIEVIRFNCEDMILMSNLGDNNSNVDDSWGDSTEDLG